jgi:hypothetical protein
MGSTSHEFSSVLGAHVEEANAMVPIDADRSLDRADATYRAMLLAVSEAKAVEPVREIHNRARAIEIYARQARDTSAERDAVEIRIRAERKMGELLEAMQRSNKSDAGAQGGFAKASTSNDVKCQKSEYARALEDNQITPQSAIRYRQLHRVPPGAFERAILPPAGKPSTNAIIKAHKEGKPRPDLDPERDVVHVLDIPPMNDDSLWLWGQLRDFERENKLGKNPNIMVEGMTQSMQADVYRLLPLVIDFLNSIQVVFNE